MLELFLIDFNKNELDEGIYDFLDEDYGGVAANSHNWYHRRPKWRRN